MTSVQLLQIIWIDILLSGDNALVIAMACKGLGDKRMIGILLGTAAAIALRICATGVISTLMLVPYLKAIGGLLLLWIAYKLLMPTQSEDDIQASPNLWAAIRIVVVADIVMSIDNMVAVAAVAKGDWLLLSLGLLISIPCIIGGASVIVRVLDRAPILTWLGAGLLGWIAGGLIADEHMFGLSEQYHVVFGGFCAWLVLAVAFTVKRMRKEYVL